MNPFTFFLEHNLDNYYKLIYSYINLLFNHFGILMCSIVNLILVSLFSTNLTLLPDISNCQPFHALWTGQASYHFLQDHLPFLPTSSTCKLYPPKSTWHQLVSFSLGEYSLHSHIVLLGTCKAWFPYDRPDRPSRLRKCSDDREDHMETLPRRSQTTRTTETTSIAWIELSSIRTIGTIM